jgi:DNA-binding HxlR family transcriptional regulator
VAKRPIKRPSDDIPYPLELLGERWSMLILREAFYGTRRFDDFRANLGIATNILSSRLRTLVRNTLLERVADHEDRRRFEYRLTDKGRDLFPTIVAIMQWGERWMPHAPNGKVGMHLVSRKDASPLDTIVVKSKNGEQLGIRDVVWVDAGTNP